MTCFTFLLLLIVLFWIGTIQLLNSRSSSGKLARLFARGLIKKFVGRRDEKPAVHEPGGDQRTS
jgi:hypothetical protein